MFRAPRILTACLITTAVLATPRSSVAQGSLTILFNEKHKLMLTPQPAVRQLWVAFKDRAWHFDWDDARRAWMDDRGYSIELHKLIEETTRATAGVEVRID